MVLAREPIHGRCGSCGRVRTAKYARGSRRARSLARHGSAAAHPRRAAIARGFLAMDIDHARRIAAAAWQRSGEYVYVYFPPASFIVGLEKAKGAAEKGQQEDWLYAVA